MSLFSSLILILIHCLHHNYLFGCLFLSVYVTSVQMWVWSYLFPQHPFLYKRTRTSYFNSRINNSETFKRRPQNKHVTNIKLRRICLYHNIRLRQIYMRALNLCMNLCKFNNTAVQEPRKYDVLHGISTSNSWFYI